MQLDRITIKSLIPPSRTVTFDRVADGSLQIYRSDKERELTNTDLPENYAEIRARVDYMPAVLMFGAPFVPGGTEGGRPMIRYEARGGVVSLRQPVSDSFISAEAAMLEVMCNPGGMIHRRAVEIADETYAREFHLARVLRTLWTRYGVEISGERERYLAAQFVAGK